MKKKLPLHYELEEKIDEILEKELDFTQGMKEILKKLKDDNNAFKKPGRKSSVAHGIIRVRGLKQDGSGDDIVAECLKRVKVLLVFEGIRELLAKDKPRVKMEDIARLKKVDWPSESPRMKKLLKQLKTLSDGKTHDKTLKDARKEIEKICTGANLVVTVKIAQVIATDYLKKKDIKLPARNDKGFPKDEELFSKKKGADLSEDEGEKIYQLLYDICTIVDYIAKILVVERQPQNLVTIAGNLKTQFEKITCLFDKQARVPMNVSETNYHIVATFLHVLKRLKVAIDGETTVKAFLATFWKSFYPETFDNGNNFSEDFSENPMLANLKHAVREYEKTLDKDYLVDDSSAEEESEERDKRDDAMTSCSEESESSSSVFI